jgi:hypothetical protein
LIWWAVCAIKQADLSAAAAWSLSHNPLHFGERTQPMDTKALDKQGKQHLQFYHNFLLATKICIIAVIATLVIMAATLI